MKKSTIKDIFYGVKGHMETMKTQNEGRANLEIICETYDKLKEQLSPELLNLHQTLVDEIENNWSEQVDFYFVEGFKLGLQIGIECTEE